MQGKIIIALAGVSLFALFMNVNFTKSSREQEERTGSRFLFKTKRSMVIGQRGVVATSQPLASLAGLDILKNGGNAVDAAVATAAVLNVVEPYSAGIGGDAFVMIYLAGEDKIVGLNASGRSPYNADANRIRDLNKSDGTSGIKGIHSVTVPGAFDGWATVLETYGTMSMAEVLESAIYYAENGFPVTEVIARDWEKHEKILAATKSSAETWLINGRAPKTGDIFKNRDLAKTFRKLADGGREEFYKGSVARAIVDYSDELKGVLTLKDFEDHTSTWVEPIHTDYKGYRLYELPPNGQGIAALEMLNILDNVDLKSLGHNSADYLHYLLEAKKLAYADLAQWIGDPEFNPLPVEKIISRQYGNEQFDRIDREKAAHSYESGIDRGGDTVYLSTMDKDGNAVSFIYSIFEQFGSKLTVPGTGIVLQNRGALFSLQEGHVNVLEPHKRPFHTIIPAMVYKNREFFMSYGIMGGSNQPQAHVQVLLNIIEFGMNIQEAIEAPRFRHYTGMHVMFEPGFRDEVIAELERRGHAALPYDFGNHGGGQGVVLDRETGTMFGGSDHRKDGMAVAY